MRYERDNFPKITRRQALGAIATLGAGSALLAACSAESSEVSPQLNQEHYLPSQPEVFHQLRYDPLNFKQILRVDGLEPDGRYIKQVVSDLFTTKNVERLDRLTGRLTENLAKVIWLDPSNLTANASGTATMIDESGYFVSAYHVLEDQELKDPVFTPVRYPALVYLPLKRQLLHATAVMLDGKVDMAVIFAPNGKPNKPTNVRFADMPKEGEQLWMYDLANKDPRDVFSYALHRTNGTLSMDTSFTHYDDLKVVKGMNSYAGGSGSPIINEKGEVVAISQGVYQPKSSLPSNIYDGSLVTGMRSLETRLPSFKKYDLNLIK